MLRDHRIGVAKSLHRVIIIVALSVAVVACWQ
jgi:hypothetical protein